MILDCQLSKFSFFSRIGFNCKNKVSKNTGGFIFFLKPEIEARVFWHRAGRPELEGTVARKKKRFLIWKVWYTRIHMFNTIMGGLGGLCCQDMERNDGAGRLTNVSFIG